MVNRSPSSLDDIFSALSDSTRRAILQRLAQGAASVAEVYEPFKADKSWPSISRHLRVLEDAGLIVRKKKGRIHHLSLAAAPMKNAVEWLNFYREFWDEQFNSLAEFLDAGKEDE